MYFYAHDAEDEVLLQVTVPPLIEQADGNQLTSTWTLPVEDVEVTVDVGSGLKALACNDVVVADGPTVEHTWTAVTGTVRVVVAPTLSGEGWLGTLELETVHLEGDLQPLDIETFEIRDKPIGSPAG